MLKVLLLIGIGGGIGSIFRYLTTIIASKYWTNNFPLATFFVNIVGCFLIGCFVGYFEKNNLTNPNLKLFLITGFCGGFTTFSTFANENINLFQANQFFTFCLYTFGSLFLGLCAVWLGLNLNK